MVEQRGSRRELGRRGFLGMIGAAVGSVAATGSALTQEAASAQTELDALSFYSAASQIAPDGESELVDEETVVVWAEPTKSLVTSQNHNQTQISTIIQISKYK